MKKILTIVGVVLALITVSIFGVALNMPAAFEVRVSRDIKAPPEMIWPYIADLTRWGAWSPWRERDPSMQVSFEGTAGAVGSVMTWSGKTGSGRLEVLALTAPTQMTYRMTFKDWNTVNDLEHVLETLPTQATRVTHIMRGTRGFQERVFWVVMGMQKMLEKDFARGLELLDQAVNLRP